MNTGLIRHRFDVTCGQNSAMQVVSIKEKFGVFDEQWSPKIIGSLNGQDVKLAKIQGEFVWHDHKEEDELFMVIKGSFDLHFEDSIQTLNEGEMIIVPKGVKHKPVATEECWVLLFEPQNTKHTGDVETPLTVREYQKI